MNHIPLTIIITIVIIFWAGCCRSVFGATSRRSILHGSSVKSAPWQGISSSLANQTIQPQQQQQQPQRIIGGNSNNNNNNILKNEWIVNGHLQFTFDLLSGIFMNSLDMKNGNLESVVFSPFSIQSMLMMIHLGAKGITKAEIAKVLHLDSFENNVTFSKSHEAFGQAVKSLIQDVNISKSLHSANQIFVQETLQISNTYLTALNHYHVSSIKYLNFAQDSYQVLQQINDWIEKQTQHLITNFLTTPPSPMTTLMAVNAIRFKGEWQYRFDPSDTEKDAWFRMINGQTTSVDMMVAQLPVAYAYSASLQTSIIELPFKMQRLSFFILLPNDTFGLFSLLNSLNSTVFANLLYSMRKMNNADKATGGSSGVNIRIPKFSISSMPRITEILKNQLGIKSLFSADNANLEAMFSRYTGRIHMGELLHKAVIKIDEHGSIGAAVSTSSIERVGVFNGPYFEADHPFLYLLMDKQTGLALFAGIYAGPNKFRDADDVGKPGTAINGHQKEFNKKQQNNIPPPLQQQPPPPIAQNNHLMNNNNVKSNNNHNGNFLFGLDNNNDNKKKFKI